MLSLTDVKGSMTCPLCSFIIKSCRQNAYSHIINELLVCVCGGGNLPKMSQEAIVGLCFQRFSLASEMLAIYRSVLNHPA